VNPNPGNQGEDILVKKANVTSVATMGSPAFSAGSVFVPLVLKALLPGQMSTHPDLIRLSGMPPFSPARRRAGAQIVKH